MLTARRQPAPHTQHIKDFALAPRLAHESCQQNVPAAAISRVIYVHSFQHCSNECPTPYLASSVRRGIGLLRAEAIVSHVRLYGASGGTGRTVS